MCRKWANFATLIFINPEKPITATHHSCSQKIPCTQSNPHKHHRLPVLHTKSPADVEGSTPTGPRRRKYGTKNATPIIYNNLSALSIPNEGHSAKIHLPVPPHHPSTYHTLQRRLELPATLGTIGYGDADARGIAIPGIYFHAYLTIAQDSRFPRLQPRTFIHKVLPLRTVVASLPSHYSPQAHLVHAIQNHPV